MKPFRFFVPDDSSRSCAQVVSALPPEAFDVQLVARAEPKAARIEPERLGGRP